jgi:hypothetical protein
MRPIDFWGFSGGMRGLGARSYLALSRNVSKHIACLDPIEAFIRFCANTPLQIVAAVLIIKTLQDHYLSKKSMNLLDASSLVAGAPRMSSSTYVVGWSFGAMLSMSFASTLEAMCIDVNGVFLLDYRSFPQFCSTLPGNAADYVRVTNIDTFRVKTAVLDFTCPITGEDYYSLDTDHMISSASALCGPHRVPIKLPDTGHKTIGVMVSWDIAGKLESLI